MVRALPRYPARIVGSRACDAFLGPVFSSCTSCHISDSSHGSVRFAERLDSSVAAACGYQKVLAFRDHPAPIEYRAFPISIMSRTSFRLMEAYLFSVSVAAQRAGLLLLALGCSAAAVRGQSAKNTAPAQQTVYIKAGHLF